MVKYEDLEISYHESGSVSFVAETDQETGEWKGIIVEWYHTGVLREVSHWKNDEPHGSFTTWYSNGIKEAEYYNDRGWRHGKFTEWWENGLIAESSFFVNGKLHGDTTTWHNNGNIFQIGKFVHGEYHGHISNFTRTGDKIDLFYCNGNDITQEIEKIVQDINNISVAEKTLIALQFGIVL